MEYKYKWYIPDAYLHSRGTGYFTSHEGCAFINETDRDAHVRFTFYFQDREPMTGYTSVVPARRTKHARFDLMENDKGEPVPMNVGYAVVVESDMDMPVQFSHCDTSQPELTFTTTMVPHITDRDAHVRFTFYFQDREPMTGYTSVVPARRTKHARFDLMENDKGEPVPMNVGYAVVVESDMDMPVQFSHCDTSQPELTFTTTMVPHITLDRED